MKDKLDHISTGFDAGNYAAAYVSEDLETAMADRPEMENEAYAAGFVLGFFSSFELHEIPAGDAEVYEDALYGPYGKLAVQQGWVD